jgi:hypothetical protein
VQLAMAKFFKMVTSVGYYRDQTLMAIGQMTVEQFLGLYGNSNIDQEPMCW